MEGTGSNAKILFLVKFSLYCKILLTWGYKSESTAPDFPVAVFPSDTVTTQGTKHPARFIRTEFSRVLERHFLLYLYSIMLNILWNEKQVFPSLLLMYSSCSEIVFLLNLLMLEDSSEVKIIITKTRLQKHNEKLLPNPCIPWNVLHSCSHCCPYFPPNSVAEACSCQTRWGRFAHNILFQILKI